jgi:ABC-type lipoprotein export system ATPase subunit
MVTLRNVTKTYRRGAATVVALDGVSMSVERGTFCAVMGPSGCGKSTLLNLIGGLDTPSSGGIELDGRCIGAFSDQDWDDARRRTLGLVFQAFYLMPGLTAEENVALPLLVAGESGPDVQRRAQASLEAVGIAGRRAHRPGELSGGEQQRVAIARALVHRPSLVLADEPTGNLDSRNAAEIVALLRALTGRSGCAVIMATHSEAGAAGADQLVRLKDGRVMSDEEGE